MVRQSWRRVIKGIGEKKAIKIAAMFALARRRSESEVILKDKVTGSRDAFEIFKSLMGDLPHEEFWLLLLNKANKVIKKVRTSEGGISGTVVDPKKVFKTCLDYSVTSIILGHYVKFYIKVTTILLGISSPAKLTTRSPGRSRIYAELVEALRYYAGCGSSGSHHHRG